jgi:hypothetical protein
MMTPQGLASPEDWLARLGIITNGVVIVISCSAFVSPAADGLAITQDFVRQRLGWNFAAKRL